MKIKLSSIPPFSSGRFPALLLAGILYAVSLFAVKELAEYLRPDHIVAIVVKNCFITVIVLLLTELLGQFFICASLSHFNKLPLFYTFISSALANKKNWISVILLLSIVSSVVGNYMDNDSGKVINKEQKSTLISTQQNTVVRNTGLQNTGLKSSEVINNTPTHEAGSRWSLSPIAILSSFSMYFMIFPLLHLLNILFLCNDLIKTNCTGMHPLIKVFDDRDKHAWEIKLDYIYEYLISAHKLAFSDKKFILYGAMNAALGAFILNVVFMIAITLNIEPSLSKNIGLLFMFLQLAMITFLSSSIIVALKLAKNSDNKSDSSSYDM